MSSNAINDSVQPIEDSVHSRPSGIEFEMAYQARVAIDRIRFAIKHLGGHPNPANGGHLKTGQ